MLSEEDIGIIVAAIIILVVVVIWVVLGDLGGLVPLMLVNAGVLLLSNFSQHLRQNPQDLGLLLSTVTALMVAALWGPEIIEFLDGILDYP